MAETNSVEIGPALPQSQSPLMRLPQELRLMIYGHLFSSTRFTSGPRCGSDFVIRHYVPAPHGLALLRSCRQAYVEIGKSWVGQVQFCFEAVTAMVDKLADIPLETRSLIRHIRVSAHPMMVQYSGFFEEYDTDQLLKLLPGLKLDVLTVYGPEEAQEASDTLNRLIEYSDGWKELHYRSRTSHFISHNPTWLETRDRDTGERQFLLEPQPAGWQRKIKRRDGLDSGASVAIYRCTHSSLDDSVPSTNSPSTWVEFAQALAPDQNIEDYQKREDTQLIACEGVENEMMVVVKRGMGIDYEEKPGSPRVKAGDIRAKLSGKTWAEFKERDDVEHVFYEGVNLKDTRYLGKHVDLVDDYKHVSDYVWTSTHPYRCTR
ncbi:hypothetical protein V8C35DRAFT_315793 [Trichoderma chlorosporum]